VLFLVHVVLGRAPGLAESAYGRTVGPNIAWVLSRVTGAVPLSVAEMILVIAAGAALAMSVRGVVAAVRRRRGVLNLLAGGALVLAQATGIVVGLFYLLWGFQYSRPPLERRLGWPAGPHATPAVLADLAAEMVDATNQAYLDVHGTDDAGEPTALPDPAAMESVLEEGWRRAAQIADIPGPPASRIYGPVKRPWIVSRALDWMGISGFYFPFTGEANVNRGLPAASYPHTAAHEKAHQRGINPEDEANFLGFLAAACAPDPLSHYSACLFAQRQLLRTLWYLDNPTARTLVEQRLPGVQRDVNDINAYWAQFQGPVQDASRATNDAFLRTNRVEGGVHSYGRSVELMVAWARQRGGRLEP